MHLSREFRLCQPSASQLFVVARPPVSSRRDGLVSLTLTIPYDPSWTPRRLVEDLFCTPNEHRRPVSPSMSPATCARLNESTDLCNESTGCLSRFRLQDGFVDCLNEADESSHGESQASCERVRLRRHRWAMAVRTVTTTSTRIGEALGGNCPPSNVIQRAKRIVPLCEPTSNSRGQRRRRRRVTSPRPFRFVRIVTRSGTSAREKTRTSTSVNARGSAPTTNGNVDKRSNASRKVGSTIANGIVPMRPTRRTNSSRS